METDHSVLNNYYALLTKVDRYCIEIRQKYGNHISCKKGCDACCRHISLFPVEAAAIVNALESLPFESIYKIKRKALPAGDDDPCPLLENRACVLYDARPIICRTYGYPMLSIQKDERVVDYCQLNFQNISLLPTDALIDLSRLNQTLVAINRLFIQEYTTDYPFPERLLIGDAIFRLSIPSII